METLVVDFIQFFSAIAKFLFTQGRLGTKLFVCSILIFYSSFLSTKAFLSCSTAREATLTFSL